jgi:hypothetical protein
MVIRDVGVGKTGRLDGFDIRHWMDFPHRLRFMALGADGARSVIAVEKE